MIPVSKCYCIRQTVKASIFHFSFKVIESRSEALRIRRVFLWSTPEPSTWMLNHRRRNWSSKFNLQTFWLLWKWNWLKQTTWVIISPSVFNNPSRADSHHHHHHHRQRLIHVFIISAVNHQQQDEFRLKLCGASWLSFSAFCDQTGFMEMKTFLTGFMLSVFN